MSAQKEKKKKSVSLQENWCTITSHWAHCIMLYVSSFKMLVFHFMRSSDSLRIFTPEVKSKNKKRPLNCER
jgi:hypothetical protein